LDNSLFVLATKIKERIEEVREELRLLTSEKIVCEFKILLNGSGTYRCFTKTTQDKIIEQTIAFLSKELLALEKQFKEL
jgi:hypothetical protein